MPVPPTFRSRLSMARSLRGDRTDVVREQCRAWRCNTRKCVEISWLGNLDSNQD